MQLTVVVGSLVLAVAFLATMSGSPSFPAGVVLAIATVVLGLGFAWYVRRVVPRVRLEIRDDGVLYDAGRHRIEAVWGDVAAVDLVIRGSDTGPALVLRADRAMSGSGMLGVADIGGAIGGSGLTSPTVRSTIPLRAFIEGRFAGSAVEADLRRYIGPLVDQYHVRHPERAP